MDLGTKYKIILSLICVLSLTLLVGGLLFALQAQLPDTGRLIATIVDQVGGSNIFCVYCRVNGGLAQASCWIFGAVGA